MATNRLVAAATLAACVALAIAAGPAIATASAASPPTPTTFLQVLSAEGGATWLASQLTSGGYIASATTPGTADLSATANTILALASAGVDQSGAQAALAYLETQLDTYVTVDGSDGPGQLALLILDAQVLGMDPHTLGGTDLVARVLATQQTSGTDAGLFGTEAQVSDYQAGVYNQGLALAALAAVGMTSGPQITAAESWLDAQQCPDGGWTSYISTSNPCDGDPASYEGPDTNSTALALEGLAAQGALSSTISSAALSFIAAAQDSDGGWGYEPNSSSTPGSTDPDSTALVIQAIVALGLSPSAAQFQQGTTNPVSALLSFQLSSGTGVGAFSYPGTPGPDTLATYQAVPAVAGVVFPFDATSTVASVSPTSATSGVPVTLSAAVSSPGAEPTGSVTFTTATTVLCTAAVAQGAGSCAAANAPVGSGDPIVATYIGGASFGLSFGTASLTVSPLPVTAVLGPPTNSGPAAVVGATSVSTGEFFAGSTPYLLSVGGVGFGLVGLGARNRRRMRAARPRA